MQADRRPRKPLARQVAKPLPRPTAPAPKAAAPKPAEPKPAAPKPRAMIPESFAVEFDRVDGTGMFDTLGRVRALPAEEASRAIVCRSIAEAYGYAPEDLFAVAEIGRHYLESGGHRLAAVIFEGLEALDPEQPYFALALGLAKDHLGEKEAAVACYRRVQSLAPGEARADLNLAELMIEAGRKNEAVRLIQAAEKKAAAAGEAALGNKASALLTLIGVRR